ncbi:MAG: tetratricopeptide repeat protein [Bacteroidota bacterium]
MSPQQALPLYYFSSLTLFSKAFIARHFPALLEEELLFKPPFEGFEQTLEALLAAGWLAEAPSPLPDLQLLQVHPMYRNRWQRAFQDASHQEKIDWLFCFLNLQYPVFFVLNEWQQLADPMHEQLDQIIALEENNLLFYYQMALQDRQSVLAPVSILNRWYQRQGAWQKRQQLFEQLNAARAQYEQGPQDPETAAEWPQLMLLMADAFEDQKRFEPAIDIYQWNVRRFQQGEMGLDDGKHFVWSKIGIGRIFLQTQRADQAESLFVQTMQELQGQQDKEHLLLPLYQSLAHLFAQRDRDFSKASHWLQKGIDYLNSVNDSKNVLALQMSLGNLYLQFDQFEKAQTTYQTALDGAQQTGDRKLIADLHNNIGALYFSLGKNTPAQQHYKEALPFYVETENIAMQAEIFSNLGATARETDDVEEFRPYFLRALQLYQTQGDDYKVGQIYQGLGSLEESNRQLESAKGYFRQALDIFRRHKDEDFQAELLHNLGNISYEQEDYSESESYSLEALALYQKRNDLSGQAEIRQNLGNIYFEYQQDNRAEREYLFALDVFQAIGHQQLEASVLWNLAVLWSEQQQFTKAIPALKRAQLIFEEHEAHASSLEMHEALFIIYEELGQLPLAIEQLQLAIGKCRKAGLDEADHFRAQLSRLQQLRSGNEQSQKG